MLDIFNFKGSSWREYLILLFWFLVVLIFFINTLFCFTQQTTSALQLSNNGKLVGAWLLFSFIIFNVGYVKSNKFIDNKLWTWEPFQRLSTLAIKLGHFVTEVSQPIKKRMDCYVIGRNHLEVFMMNPCMWV